MGYTLLYIAFGVVALWLLGEVLLQYKARLRWRVLAFVGFLGVVTGVAMASVVVIVLGAAGFGTGQALVTLSYRRGDTTGWALGGRPSTSRRRRARPASGPRDEPEAEPEQTALMDRAVPGQAADDEDEQEVTAFGVAYTPESDGLDEQDDGTRVYFPQPLHEDTGEYGIYERPGAYADQGAYPGTGYDGYSAPGYPGQEYGTGWQEQPQQQPMAASYEQQFAQPFDQFAQPFQQPAQQSWGDQGYGQQYPGYEQQQYAGYDQQQYGNYDQQQYQGYPQQPQQQPYGTGTGQEYQGEAGGWPQQPYEQGAPGQAYIPQQAPPQHDEAWAADPYQPRPY